MEVTKDTKRATMVVIPVAAVLAFAVASYVNLSNQTSIAIAVARQHGEELQLLRTDYSLMRGELQGMRSDLAIRVDDRFRGIDAVKMEERIMKHIDRIEKDIGQCCVSR